MQSFTKVACAVLEILAEKVGSTHTGAKSKDMITVAYTAKGWLEVGASDTLLIS